tara:strand:+ start:129975 stop:130529 length:555 start_codon:yes stop_codon:yes gene_type:complete
MMKSPYPIAVLLLLLSVALSAQSQPAPLPPAEAPSPRPEISEYEDERQFVIDVLAWEKQQAEIAAANIAPPDMSITNDPHDWHHVTGPESLSVAIENADGYVQPNYKETYRFNRTTHISFPLPKLISTEMAEEAATGSATQLDEELLTQMEKLPEQVVDQINQLQAFSAQETTLKTLSSIPATN